jgi:hypothetical protein
VTSSTVHSAEILSLVARKFDVVQVALVSPASRVAIDSAQESDRRLLFRRQRQASLELATAPWDLFPYRPDEERARWWRSSSSLLVVWLLGVIAKTTLGGVLHVLLVIAIVFLLINDDAPVVVDGRTRWSTESTRRWPDDPSLMQFLRSL